MITRVKLQAKRMARKLRKGKPLSFPDSELCPSYKNLKISTARVSRKEETAINELCDVLMERVEEQKLSVEDAFAVGMHETAECELSRFSKVYFGKKMKDLNEEENNILDCFGAYGASLWLADNT